MSKGVQIAIAVATVVAGVAWILSLSGDGEGTFRYYASVSDYASIDPATLTDTNQRAARVHGFVVTGSIEKDLAAGHVDFAVADADDQPALRVRYLGIDVPDLFGDAAEVVVEGRYDGKTFFAERVLAKCPSKYEAALPDEA